MQHSCTCGCIIVVQPPQSEICKDFAPVSAPILSPARCHANPLSQEITLLHTIMLHHTQLYHCLAIDYSHLHACLLLVNINSCPSLEVTWDMAHKIDGVLLFNWHIGIMSEDLDLPPHTLEKYEVLNRALYGIF